MIPVVFINCRAVPFLLYIMQKLKVYETRNRDTLKNLTERRVYLAETGNGTPMVRCSAVLLPAITVRSRSEWSKLRRETLVPACSKYDWNSKTTAKYLYRITDIKPVPVPFPLPADSVRHGRIWAEYKNEVSKL